MDYCKCFTLDEKLLLMQVYNFSDHYSIYSKFLSEIRDQIIQTDPLRFRRNLERLGEILLNTFLHSLMWVFDSKVTFHRQLVIKQGYLFSLVLVE